jgi:uncharacterized SAM-binding protein YcdF (DUF218 family)
MSAFETLDGSRGLRLDEVGYVLIPGRGRNQTADGLSIVGLDRTVYAADFFVSLQLSKVAGVIVASGYKSPADTAGQPWFTPEEPGVEFQGKPEADCMRDVLLRLGIGKAAISVERHSFDTVTNFIYSENQGHFADDRPVAIIAQPQHLERMVKIIAPRTLRREFMGIVVPADIHPDREVLLTSLVSRAMLAGIHPNSRDIVGRTTRRAETFWKVVNRVHPPKSYQHT